MTTEKAIEAIKSNWPDSRYTMLRESLEMAIEALSNQTPPIKDVCPECNGDGAFQFSQDPEDGCFCDKCKGSGEVYKYYTPEEYTAWMREHGQPEFELDDDCSIWLSNCDNGFVLASIGEQKGLASLGWIEQIFYICIPGQPAPPKDYDK